MRIKITKGAQKEHKQEIFIQNREEKSSQLDGFETHFSHQSLTSRHVGISNTILQHPATPNRHPIFFLSLSPSTLNKIYPHPSSP